jgi:hypothetical protein
VHLELADLVVNRQYLDPDFMLKKPSILSDPKIAIAPKNCNGQMLFPHDQCTCECPFNLFWCLLIDYIGGMVHREIFMLARVEKGIYKGKEWELIVKPTIEKWGECPSHEAFQSLTAKIGAFVKGYIQDE